MPEPDEATRGDEERSAEAALLRLLCVVRRRGACQPAAPPVAPAAAVCRAQCRCRCRFEVVLGSEIVFDVIRDVREPAVMAAT